MPSPVVILPRRNGPALRLTPTIGVWEHIEARFRTPIGAIFLDHTKFHFSLAVYRELFYRCADAAGEQVSFDDVTKALLDLGLNRAHGLAGQLFEDLFKMNPQPDDTAAEDGPQVPLAPGPSGPPSHP